MVTQPVEADAETLARAAETIRRGGLVAFPTETVYGLGANALDASAVARVFEAKKRPHFDPLIVHLPSIDEMSRVAADLPSVGRRLAEHFWPGPLTLIVPKADAVPLLVTSGLATVAVRVPQHPIAQALLVETGLPIAAPSANPFGRLSPTTAAHVVDGLGDSVDMIIDGGSTQWGVESTIVDVSGESPLVLRHGATSLEEIEAVIGPTRVRTAATSAPSGPGQLEQHYAPNTRLRLADAATLTLDTARAACLAFSRPPRAQYAAVEILSPEGDVVAAAARLFEALHRLDALDVDEIIVELVPDIGIGRAVNDRLRRAAATWR